MTSPSAQSPETYVYAISNAAGAVKIGFAVDPARRMRELNVSDHSALSLVGYAKGTREHEQAIHTVLREARLRGEWFDASHPHVRLFLDLLPKPPAVVRKAKPGPVTVSETENPRLHEIEAAAQALGMKASTLCAKAVNNPHLPNRLRGGGSLTIATMEKIRTFVASEQQRVGAA